MQIQLRQVKPTYFQGEQGMRSEIWGHDIVFNKGDYVKIVAPSGSGKTSLMHFLYGLRRQYLGEILYDRQQGRVLTREQLSDYRRRYISIVLQDLRLFPGQTVRENIDIKRQLDPYHGPEKIEEMAGRLGISHKLDSLCSTCSYGEQQRVAIIRALMQPYEFLLLDEPFSHLDNNNSQKAMDLMLEESRARGAAIIFADLERIEFFPYQQLYHL